MPVKVEDFSSIKEILKHLTSSNINLQLYKEDEENKDYIFSVIKTLEKIKYLVKVATSNFSKEEEQIIFIANQLSEYVKYDFEYNKKSKEEFLKLSSLQGCLESKITVCAGVAFAFERCMTEMGIENMLIRVKIFILSNDKSLIKVGNTMTDYSNIPVSEKNFTQTLEIYKKMSNLENMLKQYDNGNRNTFLKYKPDDNGINNGNGELEKEEEIEPEYTI